MKTRILILLSFILLSCNFNKVYKDREEDKREAEKITNKFYKYIKEEENQKALTLISDKFFNVTNKK